jgi:hypothetical protein
MLIACLSKQGNPSAAKRKIYGDMGSPCQIPLVGLNGSVFDPLNNTEKETDLTHS